MIRKMWRLLVALTFLSTIATMFTLNIMADMEDEIEWDEDDEV